MVAPWVKKREPAVASAAAPAPPTTVTKTIEVQATAEAVVEVSLETSNDNTVPKLTSSLLSKLKKAELVTLANEQNLQTAGLTKTQLIKILRS